MENRLQATISQNALEPLCFDVNPGYFLPLMKRCWRMSRGGWSLPMDTKEYSSGFSGLHPESFENDPIPA